MKRRGFFALLAGVFARPFGRAGKPGEVMIPAGSTIHINFTGSVGNQEQALAAFYKAYADLTSACRPARAPQSEKEPA